jgi:hypothetical protein
MNGPFWLVKANELFGGLMATAILSAIVDAAVAKNKNGVFPRTLSRIRGLEK